MSKITATALFVAGLTATGLAQSNTFPTSGNAGVGTTAPIAPFQVIDNTGNGILLERTAAPSRRYNQLIGSDGSWNLYDQTAAAQRIVLGANGNVGVGTASLPLKFQVADSGGTYQIGTNGSYWSGFKTSAPTGFWGFQQNERAFFGVCGNLYSRGFSPNAIAISNGNTTPEDIILYNKNGPDAGVLVLKDSGKVGIGTANPGVGSNAKLDVVGRVAVTGNIAQLYLDSDTSFASVTSYSPANGSWQDLWIRTVARCQVVLQEQLFCSDPDLIRTRLQSGHKRGELAEERSDQGEQSGAVVRQPKWCPLKKLSTDRRLEPPHLLADRRLEYRVGHPAYCAADAAVQHDIIECLQLPRV